MDTQELRAWLRLHMTEGVGNDATRRLLACFGSPQAVFAQSEAVLCQVVSAAQALALQTPPIALAVQCVRTQHWLAHPPDSHRHALWTLGDPHYPKALLQLADPPLLLYVAGQTQATLGNAVAVVGSRNPTPQGAQIAQQFGQALHQAGLCVVSGLALGIDGAAHQGALRAVNANTGAGAHAGTQALGRGAGLRHWATVAVVGTGLDRVYPRQHHTLAQGIAECGLLISEYPLGTPPLAHHFPQRNRLIAALGLGTLVVEAALKSGSLITAKMALDLGREVLAIPGSIYATQSHGCHALIRQGAKLVETAQDVLEELQLAPLSANEGGHPGVRWDTRTGVADDEPGASSSSTSAEDDTLTNEAALLTHMGYAPVNLDALQARSGLDTASLQAQLLTLELDGQVGRLAGGLFQRLKRG